MNPPFPTPLPLWLALLLKRQKRANISPPPWLSIDGLSEILDFETDIRTAEVFSPSPALPAPTGVGSAYEEYLSHTSLEFSPPFLANSSTNRAQADALPYHWLELGHLLLTHAADDFDDPDTVRRMLRDLREVRMSKLRKGFKVLDAGAGVKMNGVGGMEIAEVRGFVGGVVDGLRLVFKSECIGVALTWIIGRSIVHAKSHAKNARPKNARMDSAAAVIKTMTTCNYNAE